MLQTKKSIFTFCIVLTMVLLSTATSHAQSEVDALVNLLVQKGIISAGESIQIVEEAKTAADIQKAEGGPSWVQKIKLKGDLRLRYQYQSDDRDRRPRHRGRFRLRFGGAAQVTDDFSVTFRLASGSSEDGRSTNQTFDSNFSKKEVWIDQAYAKWTLFDGVDIYGGKMKNPIWKTSDLMWDGDLNPEGAAVKLRYPLMEEVDLFFNAAWFYLATESNHKNDNDEAQMFVFQPGFKLNLDKVSWKNSFAWYQLISEWNESEITNNKYNTMNKNFDVLALSSELGFDLGKESIIPYVGLFGDLVYNPDPSKANYGILFGTKFGDKKVKKPGQWQVKALFRRLEKDAWVDSYPDSDFVARDDGASGAYGPEFILKYGLAKNVTLGLDYYYTTALNATNEEGGDHAEEHVLQMDMVYKF